MTPIQFNALAKKAKDAAKKINHTVEQNLFIRIAPTGTATWYAKAKQNNKTLNKCLGNYPAVSVAMARQAKNEWIKTISVIPDISANASYTVREAFNDWYDKKKLVARSFEYMKLRVERHILPIFGDIQLKDLTAYALITAWKPLEDKGQVETLRKLCDYVKDMAIFVQNSGRLEEMHDLTHIKVNYPRKQAEHLAAVTPKELPELFYALECKPRVYGVVWNAMLTQFYTLSRPGEIAEMKWDWIDFDNAVIRFPAEIMKTGRIHEVPMSKQLKILLQSMPRVYEYVFTSDHFKRKGEPINRESVRLMFSKAGLGGIQTAHGIRSIGATWLAEQGYREDVAEMCLAHSSYNQVRKAYQRSDFLEKRRPIMQDWCDYVDHCRAEAHEKIRKELTKQS
ncbi:MAG: tyrosine-type recombinase/integrase [Succinivibrio sp.]|nr:tyrosine-type recombinase/integrase [Succinivibrio sp.]